MWNLLGDYNYINQSSRVTGTFFRHTDDETPHWNLLDGIILRSSIMDNVDYTKSFIITETKSISFLKTITIAKHESLVNELISDHLPVKFAIKIK